MEKQEKSLDDVVKKLLEKVRTLGLKHGRVHVCIFPDPHSATAHLAGWVDLLEVVREYEKAQEKEED